MMCLYAKGRWPLMPAVLNLVNVFSYCFFLIPLNPIPCILIGSIIIAWLRIDTLWWKALVIVSSFIPKSDVLNLRRFLSLFLPGVRWDCLPNVHLPIRESVFIYDTLHLVFVCLWAKEQNTWQHTNVTRNKTAWFFPILAELARIGHCLACRLIPENLTCPAIEVSYMVVTWWLHTLHKRVEISLKLV